jgi:two-component system phosphate regulon sensor histidine kinase PhoR
VSSNGARSALPSAAILQRLLDAADDGLLALDSGGFVVAYNAAAAGLLGNDGASIEGCSFQELLVSSAGGLPVAHRVRRRDDGTSSVSLSATTLTERERFYGEFVRNAAHQLTTPTAAIAGAIEVLQGGAKDDPEARDRFLAHIELQTSRLARVTKALLVLARAQAGVERPRLDLVTLKELLEDVCRGIANGSGAVAVACDPAITVFVERDLAEQAFTAIIENAVKHGDKDATVRARATGRATTVVEISDLGPGILAADLERIYEPFYRGGGDGFGLGLAIAAEALAALGGSLRIESMPGRGTQATVELPSAGVTEPR